MGLTVEGDYFVLGFSNADLPMAGHLRSSQHLAIIEQSLSEVAQVRRCACASSKAPRSQDYENYKKLQAAAEATRTTMSERRDRSARSSRSWEEVAEKITRGYARLQLRQLAQTRGAFIGQAFKVINEAVNQHGLLPTIPTRCTSAPSPGSSRSSRRSSRSPARCSPTSSSNCASEEGKLRSSIEDECSSVGFTLIELLVVIGDIAVLAAILAPVYAEREAVGEARAVPVESGPDQPGLSSLYQPTTRLLPEHGQSVPLGGPLLERADEEICGYGLRREIGASSYG